MRRLNLAAILLLCLTLAGAAVAAVKDAPIKVLLNGKAQSLKPSAVLHGNTPYLPLNATARIVGAEVKYDKSKNDYVVKAGTKTSTIKASQGIKVGGQPMFPMAVMSKSFGVQMNWDAKAKAVAIKKADAKAGKPEGKKDCPPGG